MIQAGRVWIIEGNRRLERPEWRYHLLSSAPDYDKGDEKAIEAF
jgi:hypothetical protein